jgi:hypothetical protein
MNMAGMNSTPASHYFHRHPLNLRHVIMSDRVCLSIIPRDSDSAPSRSDNGAKIGDARFPANAVADVE